MLMKIEEGSIKLEKVPVLFSYWLFKTRILLHQVTNFLK